MQLTGAWVPTAPANKTSAKVTTTSVDVSALGLDSIDPVAPLSSIVTDRAPKTAAQDRHGVLSYTYLVTAPESKQAALDHYLGLTPAAPAPDAAAYCSHLQSTYQRNEASTRKAGQEMADEYERYCLAGDKRIDESKTENGLPSRTKANVNVGGEGFRGFDDWSYAGSRGAEQKASETVTEGETALLDSDSDEEYYEYLRSNHVAVVPVEGKAVGSGVEVKEKMESVVGVKASRYEDDWLESGNNVGPHVGGPCLMYEIESSDEAKESMETVVDAKASRDEDSGSRSGNNVEPYTGATCMMHEIESE